jgi:hypothetical protein
MSSSYSDTAFPQDLDSEGRQHPTKSFHQLKYELSRISEAVLEAVLKVNEPSYSVVQSLQGQLHAFEKDVPYALRCRTALLSLPSMYPEAHNAIADSPEVDKRNLAATLQVSLDLYLTALMLMVSNSPWPSQFPKQCFSSTDHFTPELSKSQCMILRSLSTDSRTLQWLSDRT